MTGNNGNAGAEDLFSAYAAARGWQDSAAMVAEDCLLSICRLVQDGSLSTRDAARRMGLPKSTLARIMDKAAKGALPRELTPYMRPGFFEHVYEDTWGVECEAPFEKVTGADGGQGLAWR